MSEVGSVTTGTGVTSSTDTYVRSSKISRDDFLKLLIAQMTHQDPLQPMDNEQFISQMAQLQTLEESQTISANTGKLAERQGLLTATAMIGSPISALDTDGNAVVGGTVERVTSTEDGIRLWVGDHEIKLDDVVEVR